ncbi:tRNA uridine-5-carboxymethylaminomethyl(34) synthesis GTPase MnmE [Saccharicrinis sp. FJH62]|uniref:tRNA uridine-5-carboxymethylaminomethyl(34) synthesis GTPase MnmE n=1 Tax=Saccharicrinis sp. FJH62 TaxID=3344657 RepID=UPI0035D4F32F
MQLFDTTICAIATAHGSGAIATIRISGKEAFSITDKIFKSASGKSVSDQKHATIHFGDIITEKGVITDEVLVSVFKSPTSYTGEDSIEISCHGSLYIQQQILELLLKNGAEMARPGEFTQRAFMNGKMDLSQAEAVADLIASSSRAAHKLAMHQMRGGFAEELTKLRNELLKFGSLVELELDFAEEDVEFADRTELRNLAEVIRNHIKGLADSFQLGNAIKNGIPVAIVGETNVGKSTLLNTILNEEKAIVSEIHGTTRDVIEDLANIKGVQFRFIDTAGIRHTEDTIENLGIERTFRKLEQAQIVLLLIDSRQRLSRIEEMLHKVREKITHQRLIIIGNKIDAVSSEEMRSLMHDLRLIDNEEIVLISAKYKTNIDKLEKLLLETVSLEKIDSNELIVTNLRHYEILKKSLKAIKRVEDGLDSGISGDFLAQDIRECMHYLGEITGQISTDDMLGYIFAHFCIGK